MQALHYRRWGGIDVCAVGEVPLPAGCVLEDHSEAGSKQSSDSDSDSAAAAAKSSRGVVRFDGDQVPSGMLLLRVFTSSLNPVDWKLRSGNRKRLLSFKFPRIMGFDVCGEVVARGEGAVRNETGDVVFGMARGVESGGCAEYMLIDDDLVVKKPDGVSCADAAAVPLVGVTIVQAFQLAGLRPMNDADSRSADTHSDSGDAAESAPQKDVAADGSRSRSNSNSSGSGSDAAASKPTAHSRAAGLRVLILGGAGGVGTLAIQLAKNVYGASYVACTASKGEKEALVKKLGADRVVDYRTQRFELELAEEEPFDFVLICTDDDPARCAPLVRHDPPATVVGLGAPATVESLREWIALAKPKGTVLGLQSVVKSRFGGALVNTFGGAASMRKKLAPARYESVIGTGDRRAMQILDTAMSRDQLHAVIDREYPLEEAVDALTYLESGRCGGKLVIRVREQQDD